jgi:hypothetical protein
MHCEMCQNLTTSVVDILGCFTNRGSCAWYSSATPDTTDGIVQCGVHAALQAYLLVVTIAHLVQGGSVVDGVMLLPHLTDVHPRKL